jgi:predicted nucleotidyltransferase
MPRGKDRHSVAVDTEPAVQTIEQYPVRLAVLFGSQVRGTATVGSDVDIAVAFEETLSAIERLDTRIELMTALAKALGTNDVDVTDLDSVRPKVGANVLKTGTRLVGDPTLLQAYAKRFERESEGNEETHVERMRRFDALLERLEAQL